MNYLPELRFTEKLLHNMNLKIHYQEEPFDTIGYSDFFNNPIIKGNHLVEKLKDCFSHKFKENIIYKIYDINFCNFLCFQLPDTKKKTFAYIGPYRLTELEEQHYLQILESYQMTPDYLPYIKKFYEDLPFFSDEQRILHIIYTLGEQLWGHADNFQLQTISYFDFDHVEPLFYVHCDSENPEPFNTMKHLEERYALEGQVMQAISQGQIHKAELLFQKMSIRSMEKRSSDPIRNIKNYCIIINTLFRKAAEAGAVHPIHIDHLSSKFAHKIENASSIADLTKIQSELIHKYCILVKNHSLQGYSILIRQVLTRIDSDLTADLSLRTQAEFLNINSSYLSTLFKKEVGMTLTDYVNKKRIDHAIFLLNTTTMQIQVIARHCGISDVNYFTKTFKKYVGKTPKEYRDSVTPYKKLKI